MDYQVKLEKVLEDYLAELKHFGELHAALEYMLLNQGKRFRPTLLLSAADDLGVLTEDSYLVALALEFLHTSTLLHDDLPALDNDDYRRGKASCHRKFSESTAVLAGDLMMSLANSLILDSDYKESQKNQYIESLNHAFQKICYGQVLDLAEDMERDFLTINQYKTAALFECVFEFLNIMTDKNSDNNFQNQTIELGTAVGQLFQLINDYLDQFADPSELGRREASDQANQKLTLVSNLDQTQATEVLKSSYQNVLLTLEKLETKTSQLSNLRLIIEALWSKTSQQITVAVQPSLK